MIDAKYIRMNHKITYGEFWAMYDLIREYVGLSDIDYYSQLNTNFILTQKQLSDLIGISSTTIGQYETQKKKMSDKHVRLYAEFFNLSYIALTLLNEGLR
jgi:DNA-binding XRE family transcriptional regulator